MSVHVEINIADGAASRHLFIHRIEKTEGRRAMDEVCNYAVEVTKGRGPYSQRATFWHRYGDSELTLVAEAIYALTGFIPQRSAPDPNM